MGQWPDRRLSVLMRMTDLERQRWFSFPDIRGWKVLSTIGRPIGSVKEVFIDPNTLQPAMALLQYKTFLNFNTKMLLAPWDELRLGPDFVMTRSTEPELRPETAAQVPPTCPASEVTLPVEITMRPTLWHQRIHVKRVFDPTGPADGACFLVERYWPPGKKKEDLPIAGWLRDVAPSAALHRWFSNDPTRWEEFRCQYFAELKGKCEALQRLREAVRRGKVTLLYSGWDNEHNHAVALKEYLERSGMV